MGRTSNRERILEAAVAIAETEGLRGVTIEAVAHRVGMTKGGVQYHFSSKEALMSGVRTDIWQRAERAALAELDKPFDEASDLERFEALLRSSRPGDVRSGELTFILDGSRDDGPNLEAEAFYARWTGSDRRPLSRSKELAILALDGLWMRDAIEGSQTDAALRADLVDAVAELYRRG